MTRNLNKAILIILVSLALAVAAVAVAQGAQPLSGAYTQRLPGSAPYYAATPASSPFPPGSPYLPGDLGTLPKPGGPSTPLPTPAPFTPSQYQYTPWETQQRYGSILTATPLPTPAPFTPSQSPYVMRDSTWGQYAVKPTPVPGPFITVGSQPGAVQGGQFGTPFR